MKETIIDYGYGLKATTGFQNEVMDFVEGAAEVLMDLDHTRAFKIQFLYGESWDRFSDYKRHIIGRSVACMVRKGVLQLKFTGSPLTKPKRYRVKFP